MTTIGGTRAGRATRVVIRVAVCYVVLIGGATLVWRAFDDFCDAIKDSSTADRMLVRNCLGRR
jgi:hypothetical protein